MGEIQTKLSTNIVWLHQSRNLSDLKPYKGNPRKVTKEKYKKLIESIKANGYTNRLIINTENVVLGGNQRLKALKELGYGVIDVLTPSIPLTPAQENRINISDNIHTGIWDTDILANSFQLDDLLDWGMSPEILGLDNFNSEPEETKVKEVRTKICPHCGEQIN